MSTTGPRGAETNPAADAPGHAEEVRLHSHPERLLRTREVERRPFDERSELVQRQPEPEVTMNEPEHDGEETTGKAGAGPAYRRGGRPEAVGDLAAEQAREAAEGEQAREAGPSTRERMVDIGRGNQQAGRQGSA